LGYVRRVENEPRGHRGLPHVLEIPIGWWTLVSVVLLVASAAVLLSGDEPLTPVRLLTGGALFALSMGAFFVTSRLITKVRSDSSVGDS
jgi:hypothetical protein